MREKLPAGLDPVAVHPTHSGVGPRKGHLARFFTIFDSESTFEDPFYSFALFRLFEKKVSRLWCGKNYPENRWGYIS